ncbi:hypothetical protein G9A89_003327 [Geosiphon pyriformis]|nr:hypothetical protein G9A89_003327 [Geosiphon pyriformis]
MDFEGARNLNDNMGVGTGYQDFHDEDSDLDLDLVDIEAQSLLPHGGDEESWASGSRDHSKSRCSDSNQQYGSCDL